MNLSERIDELVAKGTEMGEAIGRAIAEKAASVAVTELHAHGGH